MIVSKPIEKFIHTYFQLYGNRDLNIKKLFAKTFNGLDGMSTSIYSYKSWMQAIDADFKQIPKPFSIDIKNIVIQKLSKKRYTVAVISIWKVPQYELLSEIKAVRSFFIIHDKEALIIEHLSNSMSLNYSEREIFPEEFLLNKRKDIEAEIKVKTQKLTALNKQLQSNFDGLKLMNKNLKLFNRAAAHDLRAPIVSFKAIIEKLIYKYGNVIDSKDVTLLKKCDDKITNLTKMVGSLLQIYSLENKKVKLHTEPVNTNELIANIIDGLEIETIKKIQIHYENLPTININKALFYDLITNIIKNAIKYSKTDKAAILHVSAIIKQNKTYQFCFKDNGIGINDENKKIVFNLFTRINESKTTGNGFGLPICKKIVSHYKGKIWIEDNEFKGTSVFFTIKEPTITN